MLNIKKISNPFGEKYNKYWEQRYFFFSKFDEGIKLDIEGLYSVKPETIALEIAQNIKGHTVLDAFCGIGGNTIAFARLGKKVISVDISIEKINMAKNNAQIYGVEKNISFYEKNILEVINNLKFDTIYLDPPWGGPAYNEKIFKFSNFDIDILSIIDSSLNKNCEVVITLPRNFDLGELESLKRNFTLKWSRNSEKHILFSTVYFL